MAVWLSLSIYFLLIHKKILNHCKFWVNSLRGICKSRLIRFPLRSSPSMVLSLDALVSPYSASSLVFPTFLFPFSFFFFLFKFIAFLCLPRRFNALSLSHRISQTDADAAAYALNLTRPFHTLCVALSTALPEFPLGYAITLFYFFSFTFFLLLFVLKIPLISTEGTAPRISFSFCRDFFLFFFLQLLIPCLYFCFDLFCLVVWISSFSFIFADMHSC